MGNACSLSPLSQRAAGDSAIRGLNHSLGAASCSERNCPFGNIADPDTIALCPRIPIGKLSEFQSQPPSKAFPPAIYKPPTPHVSLSLSYHHHLNHQRNWKCAIRFLGRICNIRLHITQLVGALFLIFTPSCQPLAFLQFCMFTLRWRNAMWIEPQGLAIHIFCYGWISCDGHQNI